MVAIVQEKVPWVFLSHQTDLWVRQGWVNNFKRHQMAPGSYKYLRIDLKEKERMLPLLR
jgi:ABC-type transport system substrate-binding protein